MVIIPSKKPRINDKFFLTGVIMKIISMVRNDKTIGKSNKWP